MSCFHITGFEKNNFSLEMIFENMRTFLQILNLTGYSRVTNEQNYLMAIC